MQSKLDLQQYEWLCSFTNSVVLRSCYFLFCSKNNNRNSALLFVVFLLLEQHCKFDFILKSTLIAGQEDESSKPLCLWFINAGAFVAKFHSVFISKINSFEAVFISKIKYLFMLIHSSTHKAVVKNVIEIPGHCSRSNCPIKVTEEAYVIRDFY